MRIYGIDTTSLPKDRESLFWVCTKAIPPSEKDIWAEENNNNKMNNTSMLGVSLAIENCIKLFYRPTNTPSISYESGGNLVWSVKNKKLHAYNPTPNYINFNALYVNRIKIKKINAIPPFSERIFEQEITGTTKVEWNVITDLGGEGKKHNETI